jgi:peptidoglycan hydrolase-like protein with peptidoglycan-binding domain
MTDLLRNGSRGDAVKELQTNLQKLGFDIEPDGIFGTQTEAIVKKLQTLFGYTVDGLVGEGTKGLITQQLGYKWNAKAPDAQERALRAQGKTMEADKIKSARQSAGGAVSMKK